VYLGKAIVVFCPDMFAVAGRALDKAAIRCALGITPALAELVVKDLEARAVRVAGHFRALGGRYPHSMDPRTRIEASVVWLDIQHLPQ
jgi:hypothetical protein